MKETAYNWLEAFQIMKDNPNQCMSFGHGCVYKIKVTTLYVWSTCLKEWTKSGEIVSNFNQCSWYMVADPSEKWVKCTHYQLWDWALRQWAKGNLSAKYRSRDDQGEIRMGWTVGEIQHKDPTGAILNGSLNYEYLDQ